MIWQDAEVWQRTIHYPKKRGQGSFGNRSSLFVHLPSLAAVGSQRAYICTNQATREWLVCIYILHATTLLLNTEH
jgi:hypothetical protein